MASHFRKLSPDYNETIQDICSAVCNSDVICSPLCSDYCLEKCPEKLIKTHHAKISKALITGLAISSVIIFITFYIIYYRFYRSNSRRNRGISARNQENDDQTNTHEDFLDEDHGPILDHPIWYINTVGLQPSVINSITVFKYKKVDNFIDGTDCSVCLSEFQDDETLRLLPKCNHAFHVSCIDTWLRSHTNCPLCRAPIVSNSSQAETSSGDHSVETSGVDETRVEISVNDHEIESENNELRSEIEPERIVDDENVRNEESIQGLRRSISLDSLSAFKISQALANISTRETDSNSRTELSKQNEDLSMVSKKAVSSSSNYQSLLNFMTSSSIGRSLQIGPSTIRRSLSCGGKFFFVKK